ncbi:hypothetical protein F4604DRAFT_1650300 [Suillus subluteus]|nr:hypothetical protein F4604DRAFT_1650300 [Suillus subluteus]
MSTHFIPTGASPSDAEKPSWYLRLSNISTKSRAANLVATALAAVSNDRIPVEDYTPVEDPWDDSDYSFLGSVARQIDEGRFDVETLKWNLKAVGWIQWLVIPSLAAYMKATKNRALLASKDGGNVDDVLAQLDNDRAYLISFLGADNKAHPMFTYFN